MTFVSQTAFSQQFSGALPIFELAAWVCKNFNEIVDRQKMKASLSRLSAKDLRDIGSMKNDVASIDHIPLPSSGAFELSQLRKSRSKNW
ncbi:MAG: hypothetical protein GY789_24855 [Hyphomicrobiales bacterium]|nr:hypothetical protein [Hyphomicrobiales bacterium]